MKRFLIVLLFAGIMAGCTLDEGANENRFTYKLNPVVSVDIPDSLLANNRYSFGVDFEKPSNCYNFAGFNYERDDKVRIISVVSSVPTDTRRCEPYDTIKIISRDLRFVALPQDYYIFKFWKGTDSIGNPIYLTKRVPVIEN